MVEPRDEFLHDPGDAATFNESMYFNFWDHGRRCGGFVRMGNRPHEGHCEVTFAFYLGDGRALFQFQRAPIADNSAFDATGMRFTVVEPFERLTATYSGKALELLDPHDLADPQRAFANNRLADIELDLTFDGLSPIFARPPQAQERPGEEFAANHYEQHHRVSGFVTYDGFEIPLDGLGLRDHSWGPRTWQAPKFYRWCNGQFGNDFGFMATHYTNRADASTRHGFVYRDGKNVLVTDVAVATQYDAESQYQTAIGLGLTLETGERLDVRGAVRSLLPLRNRREGRTTRITEGFTVWTCGERQGYGISEYLDLMLDDVPAGLRAGV